MQISAKDWSNYVKRLSKLSSKAADELRAWVNANGGLVNIERQKLIDRVYALATKYGEGTSALAAAWYDQLAEVSGADVPPAEPAPTATYHETAKAVNGAMKTSLSEETIAGITERLTKQAGVDTTLNNAIRDGAECAWIPNGDTCAFCIALASRGWQKASKELLRNGHAEHVHANCDCTYAVRYDEDTQIPGYDPNQYLEMYSDAGGINGLRREQYAANKDEINARKRAAYAERKERLTGPSHDDTLQSSGRSDTALTPQQIANREKAIADRNMAMDLGTGDKYPIIGRIQNPTVFAGKGTKSEYRDAYKYAERYGGLVEDWKHGKGTGTVDVDGELVTAELHWSELDGLGRIEPFVKKWLD